MRYTLPTLAALTLLGSTSALDLIPLPSVIKDSGFYGNPPNNFNCRSNRNPVVLIHGFTGSAEFGLNSFQSFLNSKGYCTFSKTYGAHSIASWAGGVKHMSDESSQGLLTAFISEVKAKTGAAKVDIVGHSEGGIMGLYIPLLHPEIGNMLGRVVALGPAFYGADIKGIVDCWYTGGELTRKAMSMLFDMMGMGAGDDISTGGEVYKYFMDLKQKGRSITKSGVKTSIIMSRFDTMVKPSASIVTEPGVRNLYVQDVCPDSKVEHIQMAWDKNVWEMIANELEENYSRRFTCGQSDYPWLFKHL